MIYYALDFKSPQWNCHTIPGPAESGWVQYECTLSTPREEDPTMPTQPTTAVGSSFDQIVPPELAIFDQCAALWFVIAVAIIVAGIATHRKARLNHWFLMMKSVWLLVGLFGLLSMVLFRANL